MQGMGGECVCQSQPISKEAFLHKPSEATLLSGNMAVLPSDTELLHDPVVSLISHRTPQEGDIPLVHPNRGLVEIPFFSEKGNRRMVGFQCSYHIKVHRQSWGGEGAGSCFPPPL